MKALMRLVFIILSFISCMLSNSSNAQVDTTLQKYADMVNNFPSKVSKQLEEKYQKLDNKIEKTNTKFINRVQKQEAKIQKKLARLDSNKAKELFSTSEEYYTNLTKKLKDKTAKLKGLNEYVPGLDSLNAATKFLGNAGAALKDYSPEKLQQIKDLNKLFTQTQSSLQSATEVRKLLSERKKQLQQALQQYSLGKELKKMNKEIYYYQEQMKEYKALLHDKKKLEEKALSYLREVPAFKEFMSKNSWLGGVFGMNSISNTGGVNTSSTTMPIVNGIPSRGVVQQFVQSNTMLTNSAYKNFSQPISSPNSASNELSKMRSKLKSENPNEETPDFKPNKLKTQPLKKRLEFGTDIQSTKASGFIPSTSDIALKVGYKLSEKNSLGIGLSYKMGLGNGLKNLHITNEGVGLRSYLQLRLLKSFHIQGSGEWNYWRRFSKIEQLKNYNQWQTSALLGINKEYQINKKLKGNMQLMYNFLYKNQVPTILPIVFRIGYSF